MLGLDAWVQDGAVRRRAAHLDLLDAGPAGGIAVESLARDDGAAVAAEPAFAAWLAGTGDGTGLVAGELSARAHLLAAVASKADRDDATDVLTRLRESARARGLPG